MGIWAYVRITDSYLRMSFFLSLNYIKVVDYVVVVSPLVLYWVTSHWKVSNPGSPSVQKARTAWTDHWPNRWWSNRLSIWFMGEYHDAFLAVCGCRPGHHSWFDIHINSFIRHSPFPVSLCQFMIKICHSWGRHTVVICLTGIEPLIFILRTSLPVI